MVYPVSFFKDWGNKALMERAETEGLIDIENEDLTPEGLIAKMYEWDESEHGIDTYNYELVEKELAKAGVKMPTDIRKIPPMWTKVRSALWAEAAGSWSKTWKIGEYAIGGIVKVTGSKDKVVIQALEYTNPSEVVAEEMFPIAGSIEMGGVDSIIFRDIHKWLESEITSFYYAEQITDYVKGKLSPKGAEAALEPWSKGKMYVHTIPGKSPKPGDEEDNYEFMFAGAQFDLAHGIEELRKKVKFWGDKTYQVILDSEAYARVGDELPKFPKESAESKKAPFGSVEWQDQKIEEIKEKLDRGEELDQMDIDFMEVQHQHNLRQKLYKLNSDDKVAEKEWQKRMKELGKELRDAGHEFFKMEELGPGEETYCDYCDEGIATHQTDEPGSDEILYACPDCIRKYNLPSESLEEPKRKTKAAEEEEISFSQVMKEWKEYLGNKRVKIFESWDRDNRADLEELEKILAGGQEAVNNYVNEIVEMNLDYEWEMFNQTLGEFLAESDIEDLTTEEKDELRFEFESHIDYNIEVLFNYPVLLIAQQEEVLYDGASAMEEGPEYKAFAKKALKYVSKETLHSIMINSSYGGIGFIGGIVSGSDVIEAVRDGSNVVTTSDVIVGIEDRMNGSGAYEHGSGSLTIPLKDASLSSGSYSIGGVYGTNEWRY